MIHFAESPTQPSCQHLSIHVQLTLFAIYSSLNPFIDWLKSQPIDWLKSQSSGWLKFQSIGWLKSQSIGWLSGYFIIQYRILLELIETFGSLGIFYNILISQLCIYQNSSKNSTAIDTSEIFAVQSWAPECCSWVPSTQWIEEVTLCSFCPIFHKPGCAFSVVGPTVWNGLPLVQRLLPRVHSHTFYSSPFFLTMQGSGALLISSLEEALYKST